MSLFVNKSAELITESGPHCSDISALNTAGISCFSLQIHFLFLNITQQFLNLLFVAIEQQTVLTTHASRTLCVADVFVHPTCFISFLFFTCHFIKSGYCFTAWSTLPQQRSSPFVKEVLIVDIFSFLTNGKTFPPFCLESRNWKFTLDLLKQLLTEQFYSLT